MTRETTCTIIILVIVIALNGIGNSVAYPIDIQPAADRSTTAIWQIKQTPNVAFESFWTGGGYWIADTFSNMTFSVGNIEEDVAGSLTLGNMSVLTNDTMIARDLTLGVWGAVEFSPGLFIKTGSSDIESLNGTAFAAADRIKGNYLNGTMISYYDNYTVGDIKYECIFFEYEQDSAIFGIPQNTHLVYSLSMGILIYANTSYSFGEPFNPYNFEVEFVSIDYSGTMPNPIPIYAIVFTLFIIIAVAIFMKQKK